MKINICGILGWGGPRSFYMGAKYLQEPCLYPSPTYEATYTLKGLISELSAENWKRNGFFWSVIMCTSKTAPKFVFCVYNQKINFPVDFSSNQMHLRIGTTAHARAK